MARSSIRRSNDSDLREIHSWLTHEAKEGVSGNFLCNWRIVEESHSAGTMTVFIDGQTRRPVAFQCGELLKQGILQVKKAFRGRGIGKKLVSHLEKRALKQGITILSIRCANEESKSFWTDLGFKIYGEHGEAYKLLRMPLKPFHEYEAECDVVISFYLGSYLYGESLHPLEVHSLRAVSDKRKVYLQERLSFFPIQYDVSYWVDSVVKVEINGVTVLCDKLKYREARDLGFFKCRNGWVLDEITIPSEKHPY
jgi:GNAT superfamily N-acetyltransferase